MSRDNLITHIQQVKDDLLLMGSLVEIATVKSVDALRRRDTNQARQIYMDDQIINQKRYAIENDVLILIATQQPMAHDLRLLAAMLEIASELERMGDYAKGICKVIVNLEDVDIPIPIKEIEEMSKETVEMLHTALTAFLNEDAETARALPHLDDKVDKLFTKTEHFIIKTMKRKPWVTSSRSCQIQTHIELTCGAGNLRAVSIKLWIFVLSPKDFRTGSVPKTASEIAPYSSNPRSSALPTINTVGS